MHAHRKDTHYGKWVPLAIGTANSAPPAMCERRQFHVSCSSPTLQEICDVLRGVFGEAEPVKI
jgi:hypothetical protein